MGCFEFVESKFYVEVGKCVDLDCVGLNNSLWAGTVDIFDMFVGKVGNKGDLIIDLVLTLTLFLNGGGILYVMG